jgi:hypothetical protein
MSALLIHARAAEILGQAFIDVAKQDMAEGNPDAATVSLSMAAGFTLAAERMQQAVRDEADAIGGGCSFTQGFMITPRCIACGRPKAEHLP